MRAAGQDFSRSNYHMREAAPRSSEHQLFHTVNQPREQQRSIFLLFSPTGRRFGDINTGGRKDKETTKSRHPVWERERERERRNLPCLPRLVWVPFSLLSTHTVSDPLLARLQKPLLLILHLRTLVWISFSVYLYTFWRNNR